MFEVKLDRQPENFLKKCEKELFDRIVSKLKELKLFLPRNHWNILGNFREHLIRELERA